MTILRRSLLVLLVLANIALLIYFMNGIKEPPQEMSAESLTVKKAPNQTEAQVHPDFIKEEFVLTLPEGNNIAIDKKIKDNGFTDVYGANRANDGNAEGSSYWEGKGFPSIITIDLEEATSIHAVRLVLNPLQIWGKRTQTIAVNISSDGESFSELVKTKQYTFDPNEGNQVQISFDSIETRYVQLVITENSGAGGGQVAEFEIYSR